jgi:hypothetical protein
MDLVWDHAALVRSLAANKPQRPLVLVALNLSSATTSAADLEAALRERDRDSLMMLWQCVNYAQWTQPFHADNPPSSATLRARCTFFAKQLDEDDHTMLMNMAGMHRYGSIYAVIGQASHAQLILLLEHCLELERCLDDQRVE